MGCQQGDENLFATIVYFSASEDVIVNVIMDVIVDETEKALRGTFS